MNITSPRVALAAVAVLGLVAAACSDDDEGSSDTTGAADAGTVADTATATSAGESAASTPAAGDVELATADSEFGTILVDGEGRTLYAFIPDAQSEPTCVEDCAAAWPAFIGAASAGEGVDEALIASAVRPDDSSEQITYNDWPLYYFAQDAAAGDVNGQGVGDVWYVVSADGEAIEESTDVTTTS